MYRHARRLSRTAWRAELYRPTRSPTSFAGQAARWKSTTARVNVFGAPPIDGLGTAGGFKMIIEDRGNSGLQELSERWPDNIVRQRRASQPGFTGLFTSFRREHALAVSRHRPHQMPRRWACRSTTSSTRCRSTSARYYVNNFNQFGRTWQVNVQADGSFRDQVEDLKQLQVRNDKGQMVPLGTLADGARDQRAGRW